MTRREAARRRARARRERQERLYALKPISEVVADVNELARRIRKDQHDRSEREIDELVARIRSLEKIAVPDEPEQEPARGRPALARGRRGQFGIAGFGPGRNASFGNFSLRRF